MPVVVDQTITAAVAVVDVVVIIQIHDEDQCLGPLMGVILPLLLGLNARYAARSATLR